MKEDLNAKKKMYVRTYMGGHYLPSTSLPFYSGRETILGDLRQMGLLELKTVEGHKIMVPSEIMAGRKFGKVLYLAHRDAFENSERDTLVATPMFCFKSAAVAELVKLHNIKFPAGAAGGDGDQDVGDTENDVNKGDMI